MKLPNATCFYFTFGERPVLTALANHAGLPGFVDRIATEENALTEDEILAHLQTAGHPALMMEPML
jgi:hypothetical protein